MLIVMKMTIVIVIIMIIVIMIRREREWQRAVQLAGELRRSGLKADVLFISCNCYVYMCMYISCYILAVFMLIMSHVVV